MVKLAYLGCYEVNFSWEDSRSKESSHILPLKEVSGNSDDCRFAELADLLAT